MEETTSPISVRQNNLHIALAQFAMSSAMDENLETASLYIREAAAKGADIVALPELFRSPYFCTTEDSIIDYAEPLEGETMDTLCELAKELEIIVVAGSIYERNGEKGDKEEKRYNTTFVCDQTGECLGSYRKTHIPHDPSFFEQNYFESGGENYKIFDATIHGRSVKIGVLICFDQWFPEAARSLALLGANIIFYPTAIGTLLGNPQNEGSWQDAWKTVQRGHAIANATIVCAINRVGTEGKSVFWGGSFICDAFGRILSEGSNREELVMAEVNLGHNLEVKEGWRFFKERRPDTYGLITAKKESTE